MTSHADFFRKYMDILREAEEGSTNFQVGDHITYTMVHSSPPKTFSGTIKAIGKNNQAKIEWDTNAGGHYDGPSEQDCQANGVVNQIYNLHFARKG